VWLLCYGFPRVVLSWTKAQENVRKSGVVHESISIPVFWLVFHCDFTFFSPWEPVTSHHTAIPSDGTHFQRRAWEMDAAVTYPSEPFSTDICVQGPAAGNSQQLGLHPAPAIAKEIARY